MILFNTFILIIYLLNVNACPRPEDLYPCTCYYPEKNGVALIKCAKLENNHDLMSAAKSSIGKGYIRLFSIQDSVFTFIPSDAFKGLKLIELEIKNSTIMALTDTDFAFEGLEESLEVLRMENYELLSELDWLIFSKLKKLETLAIRKGELVNIEDLGKIHLEHLKTVDFTHNRISFLHDDAFAGCKTLTNLILRNNEISVLKRTMFPNPAPALVILNLSYNKIQEFPNDIFSNMPYLRSLDIGHNEILVLNDKVLTPVWNALLEFKAMGNELRCDCRMSWILQTEKPLTFHATCAMPQTLRGRKLSTLSSKDLWCIY